jgi:hypothetical protein
MGFRGISDMTEEEQEKLLERHANELAEIFDSVQILASGVRPDGSTFRLYNGSGNFFSRSGMCHEFIEAERAQQIARQLKKLE